MKKIVWFFILCFVGCTKKLEYTKSQIWDLARAEDPNAQLVIPESMQAGIKCSNYGHGCKTGFKVKIGVLEAIAVEFDTMESARKEAKRIDQYYKYNWVFDDVTDEPRLERFVEKVYKATRPLKHKSKSVDSRVESI